MKKLARTKDKLHETAYNFDRLQQSLNAIAGMSYAPAITKAVRTFRFDFYNFAKAAIEVRNTLLNEIGELASKPKAKTWFTKEFLPFELNPFWVIVYNIRNVSVHEGNKTPSFTFAATTLSGIGRFTLNYSGRTEEELMPEIEIVPHAPVTVGHYPGERSGKPLTVQEKQELLDTAAAMVKEFHSSMTKKSPFTFHSINFDDLELTAEIFLKNCAQLGTDFEKLVKKAEQEFK